MRRQFLIRAAASVCAVLAAPTLRAKSPGRIGVAMPSMTSPRWWRDATHTRRHLIESGFEVDLQVAFDGTDQPQQIRQMVQAGARALIVAKDGKADLAAVLKDAAQRGVHVVAFDRMVPDVPTLDGYVSFDNFRVGVLQGQHLEQSLRLKSGGRGTLELFAGAPEDGNSRFFYNGAMSVLKPHLDAGTLRIGSGVAAFDAVSMAGWDANIGALRLETLLSSIYQRQSVDALLAPNDTTAVALIKLLERHGWGRPERPMPLITGQDANLPSVKAILAGKQSCTVFKDTRLLVQHSVEMVKDLLSGRALKSNDKSTFQSGGQAVPSLLLPPELLTRGNAREVLVGSGFYKAEQL